MRIKKTEVKLWQPDIKWLLKSLLCIYLLIALSYCALNIIFKPYIREDVGGSKYFSFIAE